jgi:hypothetical protein
MRHGSRTLDFVAAAAAIWALMIQGASGTQTGAGGQAGGPTRFEQVRFSRPPTQGLKFRTAKEAKVGLVSLRLPKQGFPGKEEQYVEGFARISGDETTGRLWAMAILRGPGEVPYASCGFKAQAFDFGGATALKGARATAKIDIRSMEIRDKPDFRLILTVAIWKDGAVIAKKTTDLKGDGTFSATTDPVDLTPGSTYHASGHLTIIGRSGVGAYVVITDAQLTSVHWSF